MAYDLSWAKDELEQIIYELTRIADGIRYNFSGISNDICANELDSVKREYINYLVKLRQAKKREDLPD